MPNIVLVGFEEHQAVALRVKVDALMHALGKANDAITTILHAETRECGRVYNPAPYVIVRDSDAGEARRIATIINDYGFEVEIQKIDGFLPVIRAKDKTS